MVVTKVSNGRRFAFIGLGRASKSTILVYDITDPYSPFHCRLWCPVLASLLRE